jgi:ketosteroid isomerase-like protein
MNVDAEVLAVAAAWDAALVANDATAAARFVTDDWVYVGPNGATSKADIIGWIESGRLAHNTMRTIAPTRLAVFGDTAIVSARKASTGAWDGVAYAADEWISEVFVWQTGRWLCVLSQKCPADG